MSFYVGADGGRARLPDLCRPAHVMKGILYEGVPWYPLVASHIDALRIISARQFQIVRHENNWRDSRDLWSLSAFYQTLRSQLQPCRPISLVGPAHLYSSLQIHVVQFMHICCKKTEPSFTSK